VSGPSPCFACGCTCATRATEPPDPPPTDPAPPPTERVPALTADELRWPDEADTAVQCPHPPTRKEPAR
jgi:hypothetical protein